MGGEIKKQRKGRRRKKEWSGGKVERKREKLEEGRKEWNRVEEKEREERECEKEEKENTSLFWYVYHEFIDKDENSEWQLFWLQVVNYLTHLIWFETQKEGADVKLRNSKK